MRIFAGVDCGATNLRVGLVDETGQLLAKNKIPSPLRFRPNQFAGIVKDQLAKLGQGREITALGVGTPGPLDLDQGQLLPSSNLGNTQPINLRHEFDREFNIKVMFDRDTNLALLGEAWQGAAKGKSDAVMLTLGSGVGGAIMVNGEIERGASGKAGEIGHMILQVQGLEIAKCGLGHQGCLEAYINSARNVDEFGTYLGYGLANIVDIFNPEMIIIGGGKLHLGNFLPKAWAVMKSLGTKGAVDEVEVVYAKLKDNSGIYGGVKLVIDN